MRNVDTGVILNLVRENEQTILSEWLEQQKKAGTHQTGRINEAELSAQSREFLGLLRDALAGGSVDASEAGYGPVRSFLGEV